ncbi:hypothetical protein SMU70_03505 [Streptococcus mutans NLML5]|nr:hypothetical protein SMU70_03505 [Streptococcus mutans NLML5]
MAKYGFLSVLKEEMDKHFHYDYALDWNKENHAVELSFVLEVQNADSVETIDNKGEVSNEDIIFEDYVLFYNPAKSKFDADDYLVTVPYDPKKGLSREFLAYFVDFLSQTAEAGRAPCWTFWQILRLLSLRLAGIARLLMRAEQN